LTGTLPSCRMSDLRQQRGMAGEELAAEYLKLRGLKILARNLRCKAGEIDLVCFDGEVLAIVEVRLRECAEFGGALGSVTWTKRRKIIRATQYFLQREKRWRNLSMRFDVLAVQGLPDGRHQIVWVKDAFRAP
jgi:putative endonuclease